MSCPIQGRPRILPLRTLDHQGKFVPHNLNIAEGKDQKLIDCKKAEVQNSNRKEVNVQADQVGVSRPLVDQDGSYDKVQNIEWERTRDHGAIFFISFQDLPHM